MPSCECLVSSRGDECVVRAAQRAMCRIMRISLFMDMTRSFGVFSDDLVCLLISYGAGITHIRASCAWVGDVGAALLVRRACPTFRQLVYITQAPLAHNLALNYPWLYTCHHCMHCIAIRCIRWCTRRSFYSRVARRCHIGHHRTTPCTGRRRGSRST